MAATDNMGNSEGLLVEVHPHYGDFEDNSRPTTRHRTVQTLTQTMSLQTENLEQRFFDVFPLSIHL